jgi:hypothetical protein
VLFEEMKVPYPSVVEKNDRDEYGNKVEKKQSMGELVLESLDMPFASNYIRRSKLEKISSTYLLGLLRHVEGEYLHPFFNLHKVVTYRSSSEKPNFTNVPIREKEYSKIIRRAFIPRPGRRIVEMDFSQIEVRVSACYHKDPTMLRYIEHDYDYHSEMAGECYKFDPAVYRTSKEGKAALKKIRQDAKGIFTFAEFYGDYFKQVAPGLWDTIKRHDLRAPEGDSLYEHLKRQGITALGDCDPRRRAVPGTFEYHVMKVEDRFWHERLPVYTEWKDRWFREYCENGGVNLLTGFRIEGVYTKNEITNSPIQGAAFHCLLWSLIQIQREIKRRKMASVLIGQIHDSLVGDIPDEELPEYVALCKEIMTAKLKEHFPWIITKIDVEAEATPVDGSWHEKEEYKLAA